MDNFEKSTSSETASVFLLKDEHIKLLRASESLFAHVSPAQLQKTLWEVFIQYLIFFNRKDQEKNLSHIAEEFYHINRFLEQADSIRKNMEGK
jgi:hypothetical protein